MDDKLLLKSFDEFLWNNIGLFKGETQEVKETNKVQAIGTNKKNKNSDFWKIRKRAVKESIKQAENLGTSEQIINQIQTRASQRLVAWIQM